MTVAELGWWVWHQLGVEVVPEMQLMVAWMKMVVGLGVELGPLVSLWIVAICKELVMQMYWSWLGPSPS